MIPEPRVSDLGAKAKTIHPSIIPAKYGLPLVSLCSTAGRRVIGA